MVLCPLLFLSCSAARECCHSPLAWGAYCGGPSAGQQEGQGHGTPISCPAGEEEAMSLERWGSMSLGLSWEQGPGQGGLPYGRLVRTMSV